MARTFEVSVKLPLKDAPNWLSHIEFTRDGDEVLIEIVKATGISYGEARLPLEEFNDMADHILQP